MEKSKKSPYNGEKGGSGKDSGLPGRDAGESITQLEKKVLIPFEEQEWSSAKGNANEVKIAYSILSILFLNSLS